MAKLSMKTRSELADVLPSFATATNPIDLTAALLGNSRLFSDILPIVARDPGADAVVIGIPVAGQGYDVEAFARDTAGFASETGLPVVVSAPQSSVANRFRGAGLTVFATDAEAVEALARYLSHLELMRQASGAGAMPVVRHPGDSVMLNEAQALSVVRRSGIPVVEHRLCSTVDEVVRAVHEIGFPVALKACSRDVVHKSDLGLVRLDVRDAEDARAAFLALGEALAHRGLVNDGVIVARLSRGRRELMLGGRLDPAFGPVVLVGDGGKYVEAMPDARVLVWPFGEEEVLRSLGRLRVAALFEGVRGEPALDAAAVASAAVALGKLLADAASGVTSLDINPVLVNSSGEGCVALDAVIYLEKQVTV